jgi:hypothetical protein
MRQLKIPLLILCGSTLLGALFLLTSHSASDDSSRRNASHASDASSSPSTRARAAVAPARPQEGLSSDLRAHQTALRQDVDELRRQLKESGAAGETMPLQAPEAAPEAVPDPDPEIDGQEHARAVAESLEQDLVDQPADAEWAATMDERFGAFFGAQQLAGSRLGAVDCRSTLCRLEVSFTASGDREALIDQVSSLLEPNAQGFAHIEDDDDLEIEVYLSRQDTTLPTAE